MPHLCLCLQEDMNLNEERKAPLREKDLSTKREMVVQYISATAKSVSEPGQTCSAASVKTLLWLTPDCWMNSPSVLRSVASRCHLSLHTPTFDTLSTAPLAVLDSQLVWLLFLILFSSQIKLRFNQATVNRCHSLSPVQGGWSVLAQSCVCTQVVGFTLVCLHGSVLSGWWCCFVVNGEKALRWGKIKCSKIHWIMKLFELSTLQKPSLMTKYLICVRELLLSLIVSVEHWQ